MNKVLVIVGGPTASGKTSLAIEIANHYKTEIISADSRQFFKELNIGTAKPSIEELNSVKHHFINSHSINESFNAGDFGLKANKVVDQLFKKHKVVVVAGGSGLYIDSIINGLDEFPEPTPKIRNMLNELLQKSGIEALHSLLKDKDPVSFSKIDIHNQRRVIRALEVTLSSGKPYSSFLGNRTTNQDYELVFCGVDWERDKLYERINQRVNTMIEHGLENEARSVIEYKNRHALLTVGYKEMFEYLDGNINIDTAIELIAKNSRNYAKRQITWFKRYKEMLWIKPGNINKIIELVDSKLN